MGVVHSAYSYVFPHEARGLFGSAAEARPGGDLRGNLKN